MATLKVDKLQAKVGKILKDYDEYLHGRTEGESFRKSVGFQLSSLQKYEVDGGSYGSRSISVAPKCSDIIDICLLYNTEYGLAKYILTVRPDYKNSYIIYENQLFLHKDGIPPPDPKIKVAFELLTNMSTNNGKKIKEQKKIQKVDDKSKKSILCPTRNDKCCHLNKNHNTNCNNCCLDAEHYEG